MQFRSRFRVLLCEMLSLAACGADALVAQAGLGVLLTKSAQRPRRFGESMSDETISEQRNEPQHAKAANYGGHLLEDGQPRPLSSRRWPTAPGYLRQGGQSWQGSSPRRPITTVVLREEGQLRPLSWPRRPTAAVGLGNLAARAIAFGHESQCLEKIHRGHSGFYLPPEISRFSRPLDRRHLREKKRCSSNRRDRSQKRTASRFPTVFRPGL